MPSSRASCREHALRGQDLREVWSDGSRIRGRAYPSEAARSSLERLERGRQLDPPAEPSLLGTPHAYLDRLVLRFCRPCPRCRPPPGTRRSEARRARRRGRVTTSVCPGHSSAAGGAGSRPLGCTHMSSSTSRSGRTRTRRLATSSFGARWPTGSTDPRSSGRYSASSIPPLVCSIAPCTSPRAATTEPNWSAYRYRPAEARACSSEPAAAEGRTESSPAGASGSRCAS